MLKVVGLALTFWSITRVLRVIATKGPHPLHWYTHSARIIRVSSFCPFPSMVYRHRCLDKQDIIVRETVNVQLSRYFRESRVFKSHSCRFKYCSVYKSPRPAPFIITSAPARFHPFNPSKEFSKKINDWWSYTMTLIMPRRGNQSEQSWRRLSFDRKCAPKNVAAQGPRLQSTCIEHNSHCPQCNTRSSGKGNEMAIYGLAELLQGVLRDQNELQVISMSLGAGQ